MADKYNAFYVFDTILSILSRSCNQYNCVSDKPLTIRKTCIIFQLVQTP